MADEGIKAGDTVHHGPTGEDWFALGVSADRNEVCVAGWPATVGRLTDCTLVKRGTGITDEERNYRDETFGSGWEA